MSHDPIETLIRAAGRRPAVDPAREARVRGAVHEAWSEEVARRRRRRVLVALAVAASLAAVAILVAVPRPGPPAAIVATIEPSGDPVRAGETLDVPAGGSLSLAWGEATLRLDGGTRARLRSATIVALERGAAYVSTEGAGGLAVETPFGTARDVGTQFEVRLSATDARVRVREGRVAMRGATAAAGSTLVASAGGIRLEPSGLEGWEWVERAAPPIRLEGMTLEQVMHRVAREKGVVLDWHAPPDAASITLRGEEPLTVDEALEVAPLAAGATARIEERRLVVEKAR